MKVALLGPIAWRTPPLAYGPWELVTSLLAEGLVDRGVDVTLFATRDSVTRASLDGVCPRGYAEDPQLDGRVWEAMHVSHAFARSGDFDLVHSHLDWLPLAFADHCRAPLLTTIHGFSDQAILPAYVGARSAYVSISDADRVPDLDYVATVHHGVDLAALPFSATGGENLVVLGRIHPDKGTADAIEIARLAGRRLTICGIVQDEGYFAAQVEPHLDGERVRYLGSVGPAQRAEVLGSALALLHPIAFAEPFGLSVVEAMACGTPVIAYPLGSMREVIDDGITGFLVSGAHAAAQAVRRAGQLDRATCRGVAEVRFSATRMVDDYLAYMTSYSSVNNNGLFRRFDGNPILAPNRWPYPINAVMNAGAAMVGSQTVLLCRVEDRRGISHPTVARSRDGVSNWVVDETPLLAPEPGHPEEEWGVEDPRLTRVDELDAWVITYTAFGPGGPAISLATTQDFKTVQRLGVVRAPEDKNGALLPRRVDGEYVLFHRPVTVIGARADIWLTRSADLRSWSSPVPVMDARAGGWWDSARIGMGPPPLETPEGWLVVYHGVRQTVAGALYRAGLALLDLDDPSVVLHRCSEWALTPTESYEITGDVPGVVFPCGLLHDPATDQLRLYYGAADTCIAMATSTLSDVLTYVRECSQRLSRAAVLAADLSAYAAPPPLGPPRGSSSGR